MLPGDIGVVRDCLEISSYSCIVPAACRSLAQTSINARGCFALFPKMCGISILVKVFAIFNRKCSTLKILGKRRFGVALK